jgi:GDP-L-fucose synthase
VIYFSSSAVYPIELQTQRAHVKLVETLVNFDTTRISMPDMTYGFAKLTGEYLAQYAAKCYGLDVVIYRPFSGYGPDQSFDYPFPSIIRRAVRREDPFVIWGSGNQVRDFIHIDDVVNAVFATKDILKPGEVLNLGSGQPTSFKMLAEIACQYAGYSPKIICDTTKPEGVFYRVADDYKLRNLYSCTRRLGYSVDECVKLMLDKEPALV